ncbi:hypothetical protein SAMN02745945_01714 [Peptoclostridium litorale DSM 5388]|uniref:Uncharacterized protein n=1 Tax=Peptoclostridium litorale DSM 5388 TaxID=1121324 RepID=A0A069RPB1_PEPLI|nr:hypothetical protein [Peptoclostridium litorale]KDR96012.1 hypothetical protein CLIT_5c00220 [Peptoclostridium litorale DSM 5388]SIO06671.1 hypothetical protein SAMN02745945_01714 [Peptoclostridium litorale DSM 5388]
MEDFEKISIEQISKKELLLILKSLEFTFEKTGIDEFVQLKSSILEELCFLTESSSEDFMKFLEK